MSAHPLYILKLLLTARRPSKTKDMRAVSMPFWLHGSYDAVTFFGYIITNNDREAQLYNSLPTEGYHPVKYHETIHLRQAQSVHNCWLLFYLRYGWYHLQGLRARRHLKNAGYELNPFEMEAYANMYDRHYLERYPDGCATGWQHYARMSVAGRYRAWRKQNFR